MSSQDFDAVLCRIMQAVGIKPQSELVAVLMISANTKYSPITLWGDELEPVRIIGRVLGIWRDFDWELMTPARNQ
jgi:hypothetical protein